MIFPARNLFLVGALEHFLFFHKKGIITPTDSYFSEGWVYHQPDIKITNHQYPIFMISPWLNHYKNPSLTIKNHLSPSYPTIIPTNQHLRWATLNLQSPGLRCRRRRPCWVSVICWCGALDALDPTRWFFPPRNMSVVGFITLGIV